MKKFALPAAALVEEAAAAAESLQDQAGKLSEAVSVFQLEGQPIESGDDMKAMGRAAGANGWLVKPFDPARLAEVVKN